MYLFLTVISAVYVMIPEKHPLVMRGRVLKVAQSTVSTEVNK